MASCSWASRSRQRGPRLALAHTTPPRAAVQEGSNLLGRKPRARVHGKTLWSKFARLAGAQLLLFALGAAGVKPFAIFNNTEFLMLTVISMTQAIVAILINARTLRRTIGVGGNG